MIATCTLIPKATRRRFLAPFSGASFAVAIVTRLLFCGSVHALIVGNVPNVIPATTVNPANYAGWSGGDPGWNNTTATGSNYVYLGDGWVLSARHVGYNAANGVTFQTLLPNGSPGPVETFYRVSGSYYFDYGYALGSTRYYAVSNPATVQSETGQTVSLMDSKGTNFTDLQLFRINGDPGLPSLTISSEPLPSNFTRATAPEVVAIGRGRSRTSAEKHWQVTEVTQDDWTWTILTDPNDPRQPGTHQGYTRDSVSVKRFGTNRLADPHPNSLGDPSDPGATNYSSLFEAVISDTSAVIPLKTSDGVTRDIVSMMTVYDKQSSPGQTPLEFQGLSGNSGTSVFYKRGGEWELAGIVHAIFTYPDQSANAAIYGNSTIISDLSFYNQDYFNSIKYIIDSHPDYSLIGDVNLDGAVAGDGTGPPGSDDVTDFILGWGKNNGQGIGTIGSWRDGDLNRDGKTNVSDFLMLRNALNGGISSDVMASLFGDATWEEIIAGSSVPEPASGLLATLAVAWLSSFARGRRSRRITLS